MTSLAATRFVFQVEDTFGVQIDIDGLARGMSLRDVLAQAGGHGAASPVAARADEEIALTPLQQAYLMTSDAAVTGDPVGCHIYREIEFDGADGHAVAGAWHRLTAHHEMLRARVTPAGTLSIGPDQALDVIEVPRARHAETVRARRGVWETRTHRSPAALLLAALVVSDGLVTAILSVDGLLMDGHALALILDQWGRLALDPATPLPRAAVSVPDCVRSLAVPVASAGQAHWRRALAGAPLGPFSGTVTAHLAFREALEGAPPIPRRSLCARLGASEWRLCKAKAAAIGVSASAMVFAAFAEVVLELAGEPRATFILTTSDRGRLPLEARLLVGCFASSMVVPVALAGDERFDELAARVHRALWGHLKHGAVGAAAALQAAGLAGRKPGSFPVVFTSLLGQEQDGPPAVVRVSHAGSQTSGIALDHQVWEDDGALIMRSDVADEMLPPMTADLCLGRVVARLRAAAAIAAPPSPSGSPMSGCPPSCTHGRAWWRATRRCARSSMATVRSRSSVRRSGPRWVGPRCRRPARIGARRWTWSCKDCPARSDGGRSTTFTCSPIRADRRCTWRSTWWRSTGGASTRWSRK